MKITAENIEVETQVRVSTITVRTKYGLCNIHITDEYGENPAKISIHRLVGKLPEIQIFDKSDENLP